MYSIKTLREEFPTEDSCLEYIFKQKYPSLKGYYRIRSKKAYCNSRGHFIYPLKGTIFEKSKTPLTSWFYALFLFSTSKHGVSAAELSRQLGVTYKCAFRMCKKIRSLMTQPTEKFCGVVEADETYVGARARTDAWKRKHQPVLGVAERKGRVKAFVAKDKSLYSIAPFIKKNVRQRSTLYTDGHQVYDEVKGFKRGIVWHSYKEYVNKDVHTNTIECFWGGLKKNIRSTYRGVSKHLLQTYVNEAVFSWNYRERPFRELLALLPF